MRHSELLLLLAEASDGYTASQLAVALNDDEQADVTVRAELSRLRGVLGPIELASKPYRLAGGVETDVSRVRAHIEAGRPSPSGRDVSGARSFRNRLHRPSNSCATSSTWPFGPRSSARVKQTRCCRSPTPAHGRDDYEIWQRTLEILPEGSPRSAQVAAHVERLDREFG